MIDVQELSHRLDSIFDDIVPNDHIAVRERTQGNCVAWNSLARLNLLLAIEEEFGVTLSDDEAADLVSYAIAHDVLRERLGAA